MSAVGDLATSAPLIRLDAVSIEAIAHRVAELLGDGRPLLDAAAVARQLGRSRAWVYQHAAELGAVRLGDGERPRLGFEPAKVAAYLSACKSSRRATESEKPATKPKRRYTGASPKRQGDDLLPIRGEIPA